MSRTMPTTVMSGFTFAIAEAELHADGIAAGEETFGDSFTDHCYFRRAGFVGFGEFAAGDERDSECGEIVGAGGDDS